MSILQVTVRVAWSLAIAVVAGAILIILHVFDIHPEQRLAFAVLGVIADPKLLEALQWIAVAVVAVLSAGIYNVVAWQLSKRKLVSVDDERKPITDQPQSITPNFAVERRQIAETEIAKLTPDEQAALRQMLIIGRPKNLSDQIWQSLEMKTSFVERDFTGPKGIKNEFRPALEEILTGMKLESQTGALFDVIPRVAGNDAEICVRNLSMDATLQDVEVSMPNYSETADVYTPEDIFRTLGSRDRLKCPLNINPREQKYFRFASVTKKNGKNHIRLHYDLKGQKYVSGDECVVKFRVSARDHRAQLLYQHVKIDSNGKLSLSAYRRKKDT